MNKKILLVGIHMLLLPLYLMANGSKEKEWIIPSDAVWVLGVDVSNASKSESGKMILDDFVPAFLGGYASPDQMLEKELGLKLQNVRNITVFGTEDSQVGAIFQLENKLPQEIIDTLKARYSYKMVEFKKVNYYTVTAKGMKSFLLPLSTRILVTNTQAIMEKMIMTLSNADDVTKNKPLNSQINAYKKFMIYLVGSIPKAYIEQQAEIFTAVRDFGVGINLSADLEMKAVLNCLDDKNAVNIAGFLKLSIGMASQMIPKGYDAVKLTVNQLLRPVVIGNSGAQATIAIRYTKNDLEAIKKLIPLLAKNLGALL